MMTETRDGRTSPVPTKRFSLFDDMTILTIKNNDTPNEYQFFDYCSMFREREMTKTPGLHMFFFLIYWATYYGLVPRGAGDG